MWLGYLGGSVLQRLLDHGDADKFKITVLVRSPEKAAKLKPFGVEPVIASLSDLDIVERESSKADVVFSIADSDDLNSTRAVLVGLKKRHEAGGGSVPILIHTSGTGVVMDDAKGMYPYDTIYDDSNVEQMGSLLPSQLHRNVDLMILDADTEGYVKSYIILPSTIYGFASGPFVEKGIQNPRSIQIPLLVKTSIDRGRAGMVGEGKNIWPNVHIDDAADLFIVLYNSIRSNPSTGHGRNGYYFGENGEHSLYEISRAIGEAFVALGKGNNPEPTTFTDEEVKKYFGGPWLGSNSRCRATHSRAIGWKPLKTKKDLLESIKPEVEVSLGSTSVTQ